MDDSARLPSEADASVAREVPAVSPRAHVAVSDNTVELPIEELGTCFELLSITLSNREVGSGRHQFKYRSTLGQRVQVSVMSQLTTGSVYSRADPRDHRSDDGRVWRHHGSISTSALEWHSGSAILEITHAATDESLPTAKVEVSVRGDVPFSNPSTCVISVPLT